MFLVFFLQGYLPFLGESGHGPFLRIFMRGVMLCHIFKSKTGDSVDLGSFLITFSCRRSFHVTDLKARLRIVFLSQLGPSWSWDQLLTLLTLNCGAGFGCWLASIVDLAVFFCFVLAVLESFMKSGPLFKGLAVVSGVSHVSEEMFLSSSSRRAAQS